MFEKNFEIIINNLIDIINLYLSKIDKDFMV